MLFDQDGKNNKKVAVWVVILVIILGFGAGVVGEIFARSYIYSYLVNSEQLTDLSNNFYELLAKYDFLTKEQKDGPLEIVIRRSPADSGLSTIGRVEVGNFLENLQQGTVTFFAEKKNNSKDLLLAAYQKSEALGRGFILTNDGWLVTTNQVLTNPKASYVAVTAKGEVFKLAGAVTDPLTSVVFTKIKISNAPVLSLDRQNRGQPSQVVAILDQDGGVKVTKIENNHYRHIAAAKDLIISSDKLDSYYSLADSLNNVLASEPIVDESGRVLGLALKGENNNLILPLVNFSSAIDQVLKTGVVSRSKLGVDYLDLSQLIIDQSVNDTYKNLDRGALIYSNVSLGASGVVKNSPAAQAGLRVGQVILKVEGEEVNNDYSLNQLIQEYQPGEEVELTVWEKGSESKIKVKLGK